jgi:ATP adenylyltransferase
MLTLLTTSPEKYTPFLRTLERWRIGLEKPMEALPEIQSLSFPVSLEAKARAAASHQGRPVLVDDAGLVLEAYSPFPGPLTSPVLRGLGAYGLERLLAGVSPRATMECHLGCWVNGSLRHWAGVVPGHLDFCRPPRNPNMPLSDWFVPDAAATEGKDLPHRAQALAALEREVLDLHLSVTPEIQELSCDKSAGYACPFCAEFDGDGLSIFAEMMGDRLASRVVYEDQDFVVMPPLGEFIEGGLLLLTREHIPSFAWLRPELFGKLEHLLEAIGQTLINRWGVSPVVFEHGPAPQRGKGVCCVDHAHFNIFPAAVHIRPQLAERMQMPVLALRDLAKFRHAEYGYLLVQENDGTRHAYDGYQAPTQLVRRLVTTALGLSERWHWQDYPGCDELAATYGALKGRIRL